MPPIFCLRVVRLRSSPRLPRTSLHLLPFIHSLEISSTGKILLILFMFLIHIGKLIRWLINWLIRHCWMILCGPLWTSLMLSVSINYFMQMIMASDFLDICNLNKPLSSASVIFCNCFLLPYAVCFRNEGPFSGSKRRFMTPMWIDLPW